MKKTQTVIDMKATGKRLQDEARRRGYSVRQIQEYMGLSCPQPVYRWYKGAMLPSVDHLLLLSELYGVHMEDLLEKTEVYTRVPGTIRKTCSALPGQAIYPPELLKKRRQYLYAYFVKLSA